MVKARQKAPPSGTFCGDLVNFRQCDILEHQGIAKLAPAPFIHDDSHGEKQTSFDSYLTLLHTRVIGSIMTTPL